jgi:hypothetical protein
MMRACGRKEISRKCRKWSSLVYLLSLAGALAVCWCFSSFAHVAANPRQRTERRSSGSLSCTRGICHLFDSRLCRAGLSVIERAVLARFSNNESEDGMAPLYCSVRPIDGQGSVRQFKVSVDQP